MQHDIERAASWLDLSSLRSALIGGRTAAASIAILLLSAAAAGQADAQSVALDPAQPLPAEIRAAFDAVPADPPPEQITQGSHYYVSNELAHWVLRDRLSGIGGVYIGVGTEQNFVLAGFARSAFVVLLDFDQAIGDLHYAYRAFTLASATPEEFLGWWDEDRLDEARVLLAVELDADQLERTMTALTATIDRCGSRLRRLAGWYTEQNVPMFVTDQAEYDFIRSLWQNDRVLIIRGDLTADASMLGIAAVAREHQMPVRLVYLSNTEQYFDYGGGFNANIAAQPFDESSWVLHTRHYSGWPRVEGDDYHYLLQTGPSFVAWLESGVSDLMRMVRRARSQQVEGFSILDVYPESE